MIGTSESTTPSRVTQFFGFGDGLRELAAEPGWPRGVLLPEVRAGFEELFSGQLRAECETLVLRQWKQPWCLMRYWRSESDNWFRRGVVVEDGVRG